MIDDIKGELEKECSGVVSCADILALATRDGEALSGGADYALPTGRRDGIISRMEDVHLPSPSFSVQEAQDAFKSINLDLSDLTTLLGKLTSLFFFFSLFFLTKIDLIVSSSVVCYRRWLTLIE